MGESAHGFGFSAELLMFCCVIQAKPQFTRHHIGCLLLKYTFTYMWRLVCVNKLETDIAVIKHCGL